MEVKQEPRLIRKIGFGYALDFMPAHLLVGYHQLSKKLEHAGFKIKVSLVPLNDMPPDLDMLFVPKELASQAKSAPPERIVELEEMVNQQVYSDFVRRLEEGKEICALRRADEPNTEESVIVRYRGYDRID